MTPDDLYKTILRTITQIRRVHAERAERCPLDGTPHATDALLDDMARNVAQAFVVLLDKQLSIEDVKIAFWKTYHERGEVWFSRFGEDDEREFSTNLEWERLVENLNAANVPVAWNGQK